MSYNTNQHSPSETFIPASVKNVFDTPNTIPRVLQCFFLISFTMFCVLHTAQMQAGNLYKSNANKHGGEWMWHGARLDLKGRLHSPERAERSCRIQKPFTHTHTHTHTHTRYTWIYDLLAATVKTDHFFKGIRCLDSTFFTIHIQTCIYSVWNYTWKVFFRFFLYNMTFLFMLNKNLHKGSW